MELMRNCYCNRAIPVDRQFLLNLRDEFFSRYRWFYDESRGISRNHQNPGNYDEKYRTANHLEESKKWKLIIGSADYSKVVVTPTAAVLAPALTEDEMSKKARKAKAKAAQQSNIYTGVVTVKKSKPSMSPSIPTLPSPAPVQIIKVPQIHNTPVAKNPTQFIRHQDSAVSGSLITVPTKKYGFEDVQAVIREGDVMEERIKQESRLRIVAAQEHSRLVVEATREKARILYEEAKVEEQRIIGLQRQAKEQSILNAHNEGNRHYCVITLHYYYYIC